MGNKCFWSNSTLYKTGGGSVFLSIHLHYSYLERELNLLEILQYFID